ncbi:MAG: DUF302 domain-containing protein [Candidatus Magnetomorum sp.]|nr:DUF302 domain-containing protein [Candidatus Magnetomorum sp.]
MLINQTEKESFKKSWLYMIAGIGIGVVLSLILVVSLMPSMMIVTKESKLGFDDTVVRLVERIKEQGWSVKIVSDVKQEINHAGYNFQPRVKIIKLCKAEYAKEVLTTDRFVSCLMPCSMAIWEGDDGKVYLSEMNMALMAKMFGGNIGKVMGGKVVNDEEKMIEGIFK